MGSTRWQMLGKVQLPLARRMLLLGVNQTILFALSMVVIAGLIGGGGLGAVVNSGLSSTPALALLAGFVIVVMAIALDRVDGGDRRAHRSRATPSRRRRACGARGCRRSGRRGDRGRRRRGREAARRRRRLPGDRGRATNATVDARRSGCSPGSRACSTTSQDPTSWVFSITEPIGNFILQQLLLPLQQFLVEAPWFVTLGRADADRLRRLRACGRRSRRFVMLGVIGVTGVWALAMDTLSQVLVATLIAVADRRRARHRRLGEPRRVSKVLRPMNDVLQTLPQLVYIIPFIYLMPVSIVPGIIAGVLYAFPVVVRLVERGLHDVAPQTVEAAGAFGATRRQVLTKVKIPLAGDAIMLGVNQGIIMVLAVVVIGGLVGSRRPRLRGRAGARPRLLRPGRDRLVRDPRARDHARLESRRARARHGRRGLSEAARHDNACTKRQGGSDVGSSRSRRRLRLAGLAARRARRRLVLVGSARRRGAGGGVRRRRAERELVGRVDRERLRRQERPREEAQVQGQGRRTSPRASRPSRRWPTGRSTSCSRTGRTSPGDAVREERSPSSTSGTNGITGVIGWYIPRYLLKQYPHVQDVERASRARSSVFKSPESGSQGMFLGGDPSYVQKDRALIKGLGLNLKHVVAGAEPAQVARWTQLYKQKKPVLFYWYDPQYLNAAYDLVQVQLPKRHEELQGRREEGRRPEAVRLRVPVVPARQARQHGVLEERLAGAQGDQEVQVDVRRPELRREPDLGQEACPRTRLRQQWVKANAKKVNAWLQVDRASRVGALGRPDPRLCATMTTPTLHIHEPRAADARSLSDRAYYAIRELIVTLELPPGSVVSERELMERLGLGRTPVREALRDLAREQLVEVYPRRGMFVSGIDVGDIAGLSEVRLVLESQAARLAAERRNEADRDATEALLEELERDGRGATTSGG